MAEKPAELDIFEKRSALFVKITKLIFGPPYGSIGGNISALSESFNVKKLCSRILSRECQFYSLNS